MIFVECKPDEVLVKVILPRRETIDELKGRPAVVRQVQRRKNAVGLVDEDPRAVRPRYLTTLTGTTNRYGFRVLADPNKRNRIVVLRPRLEDWVLAAAQSAQLDIQERYGLPADARRLHEVINYRLENLDRLLKALRESAPMQALRKALTL